MIKQMTQDEIRALFEKVAARENGRVKGLVYEFTSLEDFYMGNSSSGYIKHTMLKTGKKRSGNLLDGHQWQQMPRGYNE